MSQNKKTYAADFQRDAIKLALRSSSIKNTAKELGIPSSTLHTWIKLSGCSNKEGKNTNIIDLTEELKNLRKEVAKLREEKEILKKAAAYFARELK